MDDSHKQSIYHDPNAPTAPAPTAGRVAVSQDADGNMTITTPAGEKIAMGKPVEKKQNSEVTASNGRALLAELRARRQSLIVEHEIEGQSWYLLTMNETRINEVAVRTMAMGDGTLNLRNNDVLRALTLATLQVGVVQGPRDPTPFFNAEPYMQDDAFGNLVETTEIEQACEEPEFNVTAAALFDKLTDLNPTIFPQKKMVMEAWETLQTNWTSPPSTNGSTESIDAPDSPPLESESSESSEEATPPL